ncbi:MAG: hypothetical protein F6K36_04110 [Symploca sp. SIO3C6]|uniref:Uncharacterized protein n=1 Tax=Symploca sp. SIO1C4 TaxID=2607765 RepID=A0A6B3MYI0_9CYAN|nr:hypothetical protein [Symploca sp. SIO3C6]NER26466.1 hypothetical protein [Symploca sp. SIO1C4]
MKNNFLPKYQESLYDYQSRTTSYYLQQLDTDVLKSFSSEQLEAITYILNQAIPKPSPKIVDLRFVVNLIFSKFYIVLFVGKDKRKRRRPYNPGKIARIGNLLAATILLIGLNFVLSAFILLIVYLTKSALGIDIFPGHLSDILRDFL